MNNVSDTIEYSINIMVDSLLQKSLYGNEKEKYTKKFIKVGKILDNYIESHFFTYVTSSQMETRPKRKKKKRDIINPLLRDKFFDMYDLLREIATFVDYDVLFKLLLTNIPFNHVLMDPNYDTFWEKKLLKVLGPYKYPKILEKKSTNMSWYEKTKLFFEEIKRFKEAVYYKNAIHFLRTKLSLEGNEFILLKILKDSYTIRGSTISTKGKYFPRELFSFILNAYLRENIKLNDNFLIEVIKIAPFGNHTFATILINSLIYIKSLHELTIKREYNRKKFVLAFIDKIREMKEKFLKEERDTWYLYQNFRNRIEAFHTNEEYKKLLSDKKIILESVKIYGRIIEYEFLDSKFYYDPDVILGAIKTYPKALNYANKGLKKNDKFILKAVKVNGLVLRYVEDKFRRDDVIVQEAIKQNPKASKFSLL